ncbi:hypothetical protein ABT187_41780 [Streptomyces sp. NPDC001817]|uniref:hypothetical protein n=1 Tax=Streptomyces sp. NPDC001817 TaxID=3154398 RepID=UPI00332DBE07
MSDQNEASTLAAAAVIAVILIARAAALHRSGRGRAARTVHSARRHTALRASTTEEVAAPAADGVAACAVREAEQHVHHCWQQLQTHVDPPE